MVAKLVSNMASSSQATQATMKMEGKIDEKYIIMIREIQIRHYMF